MAKRLPAKLVDGFAFTMPDTAKNQAAYPQQKGQKAGAGLPIARAAVIISLATGCMLDLAIAPYQGKETGESALLRSILGSLSRGDIAVMDRYYCSYIAELYGFRWNSELDISSIKANPNLGHVRCKTREMVLSEVGNRPGRLEPRVIKRRRHGYKRIDESREQLRSELRKHCT